MGILFLHARGAQIHHLKHSPVLCLKALSFLELEKNKIVAITDCFASVWVGWFAKLQWTWLRVRWKQYCVS